MAVRKIASPSSLVKNLYLCKFVDDSQSMFPFTLMRRGMVDSWIKWKDEFDPFALRPYGDLPVWIG